MNVLGRDSTDAPDAHEAVLPQSVSHALPTAHSASAIGFSMATAASVTPSGSPIWRVLDRDQAIPFVEKDPRKR